MCRPAHLFAVLALLPLIGCGKPGEVDFGKAQAIRPGMTYQMVSQIIGGPGRPLKRGESILYCIEPSAGEVVYIWANPNQSHLCIAFRGGRVWTMAASDLKHTAL